MQKIRISHGHAFSPSSFPSLHPHPESFFNPAQMGLPQSYIAIDAQQPHQHLPVNELITLRRVLNLHITAMGPFGRMFYRPGSDHIQINVCDTLGQMSAGLNRRCMIAIFPKSALPLFPPVVGLSRAARGELDGLWNNLAAFFIVD